MGANFPAESLDTLFSFVDMFAEVLGNATSVTEEPPNFHQRAWPLLVESMCSTAHGAQYYLSCNELLLCCELAKKNVVVFGRQENVQHALGP